jgi:hypothetical protein
MKRTYLVAAAAFLIAALGIYWFQQWRATARRLAEWEAERAADAVPPVLSEAFAWERAELTLGQFADLVAARSGLKVEIDHTGMVHEKHWKSKPEDIKVSVPSGGYSLRDMLWMVLAPVALEADVRGHSIVITAGANSNRHRPRTVVYPVPQPKPVVLRESDWQQLIWANIDGHAEAVPGAIIVVADAANQKRARLVIDTICALREPAPEAVAIPAPFGDTELMIRRELDRETNIDFVEQPFKDAVLYLSELHNIPLILAADKLEEASVSVSTPITKTLRGVSLRSALRLILKDLELTFAIRDQALVITTPEDAESHERTVGYRVRDITQTPEGFSDVGSLGELIWSTIAPDRWGDGNGGGPRTAGDDWLVIDQTDEIHEQIAALLATLRQMLAVEGHFPSQPIGPTWDTERRIRAAIERPIELDVEDLPLKDVVLILGESLKVPILLSFKKLEEASISADTPVTFKTSSIPARSALEQLLKTAGLDFVIRDEVLQITTPEDSESQLVVRVYDTRAILARMDEGRLRGLIRTTIHPGPVITSPGNFDFCRGLLVVIETDRVHQEVERLVEDLTSARAEAK